MKKALTLKAAKDKFKLSKNSKQKFETKFRLVVKENYDEYYKDELAMYDRLLAK